MLDDMDFDPVAIGYMASQGVVANGTKVTHRARALGEYISNGL
jgi:hypothetical protein